MRMRFRQVVDALPDQLGLGDHVDRDGRCRDRAALGTGADDDDRLFELRRFFGLGFVLVVALLGQNRSCQTERQEQDQQVEQVPGHDFAILH